MNETQVAASYTRRAGEYIARFGSVGHVHPADLDMVRRWANQLHGPVLDAGCGPGHLSAYLHSLGINVTGIDLVAKFIAHAQVTYPLVAFKVGSMTSTGLPEGSLSGILAWYSLIHLKPTELGLVLAEFRRVLAPGGKLLLGFFDADVAGPFDHKVVRAYAWPADELAHRLTMAGFQKEQLVTRMEGESRPHAAIAARAVSAHPVLSGGPGLGDVWPS